jgi:hypothetical protein
MSLTSEQKEIVTQFLPSFEVTDETTMDDVNEAFGKTYVKADIHDAELKKRYAQATAKAENRLSKLLGSDANGKQYDEMVELLEAKIANQVAEMETLKEASKGTGKNAEELIKLANEKKQLDEALKEAQAKIAEAESAKEGILTEAEKKYQKLVLDGKVNSIFESIDWVDGVSKYTKGGLWNDEVNGKVTFVEEGNDLIVYDATGENWLKDGVGKMTAKKFFTQLAEKENLIKKNGATNKKLESEKKAEGLPASQAAYLEKMRKLAEAQTGK